MANASRRRSAPDGSDNEEDRASSSSKRAKLESQKPTRRELSPESDGDNLEADEDDSMGEGDDFTEEAANEAYRNARQAQKGHKGTAATAGVIKHITLVDFMCHRNLSVDFGARMNFLVGNNGSGKSAILTAIAVGLGGKAAMTGRGAGLKDLIRSGADRAIITLTISNEGYNAFKAGNVEYDPNIVIVRQINRSGQNSWKFKSSKDGRILSQKKTELDRIVNAFSIDVDQPLTILTQDAAREFLQKADEQELYKFFMRGTQLAAMNQSYADVTKNINGVQNTIGRMKEELPEKKIRVAELEKKLEATKKIADLKDKLQTLNGEHGWALVIEKEKHRDDCQLQVDQMDEKVRLLDDAIAKETRDLDPVVEQVANLEEEIQAYLESKRPIEEQRKKAKNEYEILKTQCHDLNEVMSDHKRAIAVADKEVAYNDREIARHRQAAEGGQDSAILRKEADLKKFEELEVKLQREVPKREETVERAVEARRAADAKLEEANVSKQLIETEIVNCNSTLRSLTSRKTNELAAYGQKIEIVLSEIDRARWQGPKPVGPLGRYVKLKDFRYKALMEANLGNFLCAFAVQDSRDKFQLQEILKNCARRGYRPGFLGDRNRKDTIPSILVSSNDIFDYSSGDNTMYGETIISKLHFTDEYVKRVLINQASIEKNFVAVEIEEANVEVNRLVQLGIGKVAVYAISPHLVKQDGDLRGKGASPVTNYNGYPLFSQDITADLQAAQNHLNELVRKRDDGDAEFRRLKAERDNLQHEWSEHMKALDKARKSIPAVTGKILGLREELRAIASDVTVALELAKQTANDTKNTNQIMLDSTLKDFTAKSAELDKARVTLADLQASLDNFVPERTRKQNRLTQLTIRRQQILENVKHFEKSKASAEQKQKQKQAEFEAACAMVADWTAKTQSIVPNRINVTKSVKAIVAETTTVTASIKAAERRQGLNVDLVREQYVKAKRDLDEMGGRQEKLVGMVDMLIQYLDKRGLWWLEMRKCASIKVMTAFIENTGQRGFDGRVEFDHGNQRLRLKVRVNPAMQQDEDVMRAMNGKTPSGGTKTLSGGERSFSTISFLLAMWEAAGGPLRCLDEWDVFLDSINRNLAAKMLIEGAKAADEKQYILITPQGMDGFKVDKDSKIIKMQDPIRNQGTLPFQPAAS